MSVQASSWVIKNSRHKGSTLLLLLMIANHAHADGTNAFPSIKTLALECRMSERQIVRLVAELERSGELIVNRSVGRETHTYAINMTNIPDKLSSLNPDKLSESTLTNPPPNPDKSNTVTLTNGHKKVAHIRNEPLREPIREPEERKSPGIFSKSENKISTLPTSSDLTASVAAAVGFDLPNLTQERIDDVVPVRFGPEFVEYVKNRRAGLPDSDRNYVLIKFGTWLDQFQKFDLPRLEKQKPKNGADPRLSQMEFYRKQREGLAN